MKYFRKKKIRIEVILIFIFLCFNTIGIYNLTEKSKTIHTTNFRAIPKTAQGTGTLPNGAQYSWGNYEYEAITFEEYENEKNEKNITGTVDDTYPGSKHYWHWNASLAQYVYIEEDFTIKYKANYTSFRNSTISGNCSLKVSLDMYYVNVVYGNSLELFWMALKNGTFTRETYTSYYEYNCSYFIEYLSNKTFIERRIYNTTGLYGRVGELLWIDIPPNEIIEDIYKCEYDNRNDELSYNFYQKKSTEPIIISMQTYTPEDGDEVVWMTMMNNDFIIYNDTDENMIFSAGNAKSLFDEPYVEFSDETFGWLELGAKEINLNHSLYWKNPKDISIEDISSNITFIPPTIGTGNNISWGITYDEYPTGAIVLNEPYSGIIGPWMIEYDNRNNVTYNNMSPMNFSYQFVYNLQPNKADLDYSFEMSKISNSSLYDAIQGYSLSIPIYSYFLSTSQVSQTTFNDLNLPHDSIDFALETNQIGKIDMKNPLKINYTLYNYTGTGDYDEFESIGASINDQTINVEKESRSASNPNLILFNLGNITKERQPSKNFIDFYSISTINYPQWSGEKLSHDPTFTAFFRTEPISFPILSTGDDDRDKEENNLTLIVIIVFIICSLSIVTASSTYYYYEKRRKTRAIDKIKERDFNKSESILTRTKASVSREFEKKEIIIQFLEKIDNSKYIQLLKEDIDPNEVNLFQSSNMTMISNEFWEKLEKLNLDKEDIGDFINEMISLTPKERHELLDEMLLSFK